MTTIDLTRARELSDRIADRRDWYEFDPSANCPAASAMLRTLAAEVERLSALQEDYAQRGHRISALVAEVERLQAAQAVPAEHLPTAAHIQELAQEAVGQIMEQAQVFASAWSLVGGRFDSGNAMSDADDAKAELHTMVRSLADLAAQTVRPASPGATPPATAQAPQAEPVVFARRWKIAADGFGLQRDDEGGPYVHIDDALDVLHASLAKPDPQAEPVAQGLTDEEADAIYRQWAHDDDMKSVRALVRVVERNRAAAWGVKLEGGNHE